MTEIERDFETLLKILAEAPRDSALTGEQLQRAAGIPNPYRVNDAMQFLVDARFAHWLQTFGTAPFDFAEAEITPLGRREYQKSQASGQVTPTPQAAPIRVFISHSSRDKQLAEAVADLLRAALTLSPTAIRCTSVDGYRLPGGAQTSDQLRREIVTAEAFIGIISDRSVSSEFVLFELGARWGVARHLIPLMAGGMDVSRLPKPLSDLNALRADQPASLHQLVADIAGALQVKSEEPSSFLRFIDAVVHSAGENTTALTGQPSSSDTAELRDDDLKILELLSRHIEGLEAGHIAGTLRISRRVIDYHVDKLLERNLIEDIGYSGSATMYLLSPTGRRLLFDSGLLT